jgi:hypothetical protein
MSLFLVCICLFHFSYVIHFCIDLFTDISLLLMLFLFPLCFYYVMVPTVCPFKCIIRPMNNSNLCAWDLKLDISLLFVPLWLHVFMFAIFFSLFLSGITWQGMLFTITICFCYTGNTQLHFTQ